MHVPGHRCNGPRLAEPVRRFDVAKGIKGTGERPCSVDECSRPVYGRGWCRPHYRSWCRHGDPLAAKPQLRIEGDANSRFWARVGKPALLSVRRPDLGPCHPWLPKPNSKSGYGQWYHPKFGKTYAHVIAYRLSGGTIPDGWQVDHLCFVRICCNPAHLEAVTPGENLRRAASSRTHCKYGHPFNEENTHVAKDGHRVCRVCWRRRAAEGRARKRGLLLAGGL